MEIEHNHMYTLCTKHWCFYNHTDDAKVLGYIWQILQTAYRI